MAAGTTKARTIATSWFTSSTPNIFLDCHRFKMGRINASPVMTKMIDTQFIRNRAYKQLIGQTMSGDAKPLCVISANNEHSISGVVDTAFPKPATIKWFLMDLGLKSFKKRFGLGNSLLPILQVIHD